MVDRHYWQIFYGRLLSTKLTNLDNFSHICQNNGHDSAQYWQSANFHIDVMEVGVI